MNRRNRDPVRAADRCIIDTGVAERLGDATVSANSAWSATRYEDSQAWPPLRWHARGRWDVTRRPSPVRMWRSTLVRWAAVDEETARLERATDRAREAGAHRPAIGAEEVGEMWACRACGCATRRPPHAPTIDLSHYTDCRLTTWRTCWSASKLLKCRIEVAQGVVARRYRCWECRKVCAESTIEFIRDAIGSGKQFSLRDVHRRRCTARDGSGRRARAETMRVREVAGQETLFTPEQTGATS